MALPYEFNPYDPSLGHIPYPTGLTYQGDQPNTMPSGGDYFASDASGASFSAPQNGITSGQAIAGSMVPGGIQAGLGLVEGISGLVGLNKLNKQAFPEYGLNGELSNYSQMARSLSQQGFSPEESAAFRQSLAEQQNATNRTATEIGGGSGAKALSAAMTGQDVNALNKFAAQGAQLKSQHMDAYRQAASQLQQQQNLKTQADIDRRNQLEHAYGGALQQGLTNFSGGLSSSAGMGLKAATTLLPLLA